MDRACLLALEFAVASLEAAADTLQERGVAFVARDNRLAVDPEQGFGTGFLFGRDRSRAVD